MATTVTQSELDKINQESSGTTSATSEEQTYTGKFVGTLIGNATTAKELEAPYNFSLSGDASGTVAVNAKSVILETTVNHAKQADTADFAGKTNLSARASLADMANTAEFAYRAGKIAKIIINLTGVVTGKGESTNSESVDIEVTDFDASKQFVVGAPTSEPDTSKVYIDVKKKYLWIYDNVSASWVNCFKQLADELDNHNLRIETLEGFNLNERVTNLEGQTSTLEDITVDHESRITANKKVVDNHELRLNNIETTTDLGQVTLRITAIEEKNKEQDTSLEANATAIAKEVSDREQAITTESKAREDADNALGVRIDNADAKNTEQDTHLGTIDTHLETIDTHLGTIDDKNTEQDTALETAKSELNASIGALSQKLQANYIDKTSEQEIATGVKAFSGGSDVNVFVVKGDFDLTQAPAKTCYSTIPFHDKNNKVYAYLQAEYNTEQTRAVRMLVASDNDKNTFCVVGGMLDKAGTPHSFTNHPDTACTTNEIATAWFVKKVVPFPAWSTKIAVPIDGTVFTVPTEGWIDVTLEAYNNVNGIININGELRMIAQSANEYYSTRGVLLIPVVKGDTFSVQSHTANTATNYAFFYSLKYGSVS